MFPAAHVVVPRIHDSIHDARDLPLHRASTQGATIASLVSIHAFRGQDGVRHSLRPLFGLVSSDVVPDCEVSLCVVCDGLNHILSIGFVASLMTYSSIE